MTLVKKLYKSRTFNDGKPEYKTDVAKLVKNIESKATRKGLNISRWQTNSRTHGHTERVSWAVHYGNRADRFDRQENVVASTILDNDEGQTKNCEAYRELAQMIEEF